MYFAISVIDYLLLSWTRLFFFLCSFTSSPQDRLQILSIQSHNHPMLVKILQNWCKGLLTDYRDTQMYVVWLNSLEGLSLYQSAAKISGDKRKTLGNTNWAVAWIKQSYPTALIQPFMFYKPLLNDMKRLNLITISKYTFFAPFNNNNKPNLSMEIWPRFSLTYRASYIIKFIITQT